MARFQRIFFLPLMAALFGLFAAACGDDAAPKLNIIVRTDLVAGQEFSRFSVAVEPVGGEALTPERVGAPRTENLRAGYEITSLRRLPTGPMVVRVTLEDASRNAIMSREIKLDYAGNGGDLVFVISRSCLGVSCGDGEACQAGECTSNECHPGAQDRCPSPECTSASGCPNAEFACAVGECAEGVCFLGALTRDECRELDTCCASGEWCNPVAGCTALPEGPEAGMPDSGMVDMGGDMTVPTDGAVDMMPDAAPCVENAPCTPTGYEYACYTAGRISCAMGGACVGRSDSARDTGASCGFMNSRVCNEAKECVDCFGEGEACILAGSCQLGIISRSAGCKCVANSSGDFLETGTQCATGSPNRYCTTGGSCLPCAGEGTSCGSNTGIRGCIRSRLTCAVPTFEGAPQCVDDPTFRPAGSICAIDSGNDGLCSGASPICEGCQNGLSCLVSGATGNAACVRGTTVCDTGMGGGIECDAAGSSDFVAPGESCGNNQVCTGAGSCIACTQGAACNTDRKCSASTVDCSGGSVSCELDESVGTGGIIESGANGRRDATSAEQCSTTETCNGIGEDCQAVMSNVSSIAVGPNHSCAIAADNAAALSRGETYAACWGANFRSSVGVGVISNCNIGRAARVDLCNDDATVPGTLCRASVSGPKEIVVGHSTSCLIDSEGAVFCWGNNLNGEVGGPAGTLDGDGIAYRSCGGMPGALPLQERSCVETAARKVRLPAGQRAVQVAISQEPPQNCSMGYSNSVTCEPTGPEWRRVCAVTEAGKLYCWGGVAASGTSEILMSLMRPSMAEAPEFHITTGPNAVDWRFEQVAIGTGFWCTLVRDRSTTSATRGQTRVLCAGEFAEGQRGDGLTTEERGSEVPRFPPNVGTVRPVVGLTDAVDISASADFACAVRAAGATTGGQGRVVCWGRLGARSVDTSEIGGMTTVRKPVYVRAAPGVPLRYIDDSGTLPPPESGLLITGATDIATGPQTSCVRLSTGRLRCWGSSYLGIGTVNTSTYGLLQETQPTREINPGSQLSTMSTAVTTSMSLGYHTDDVPARSGTVGCYIRDYSRRQLFCWGSNGTRQLGHCISTQGEARLTPVPVLPHDPSQNGICRAGDTLMAPSMCNQTDPM